MKEPRAKKVAVPNGISENGVLAASLDVEVGKQAVQYQVCGPAPPQPGSGPCPRAGGAGQGLWAGPPREPGSGPCAVACSVRGGLAPRS